MTHPVQQDGSSCGVIVVLMARGIMNAFPAVPVLQFGTSRKEMGNERKIMALQILKASVFDEAENCAMCSLKKTAGSVHRFINWIQCDTCERWYHEECLGMAKEDLEQARANKWNCILCS
ncbi:lysine-specific demethylase 5A-like [Cyprinus carpio]|uniref:Lysine-specific demethylase 5A-like n=2 Tax=Cyprinus carpio TaxID=7962 RepID=A0A9Q9VQB1_CYPCA|nr:lysine-specific demethylase 5A-like [Cyprinus carpio]